VWDNEKLSTRAQVRSDGKLSFPLLNEIEVAGKAPKQVSQELERRLREANLVIAPRVNVAVEPSKLKVAVVGAVSRAGTYEIEPGGGVVEALASAGGLTEFAHRDRIYVVRLNPRPLRIRFSFDALTEVGRAALFRLQAGDRVIAE
jgi:polysaccharide export outer membrane protein